MASEPKTKEEPRESNKVLVWVLCGLVTVAVALVVVNVIYANIPQNNNLAEKCMRDDGGSLQECLRNEALAYINDDDCEKALKVYTDASVDGIDEYSLADFYDEAYSMSLSCEDETLQGYWKGKHEELSSRLKVRD